MNINEALTQICRLLDKEGLVYEVRQKTSEIYQNYKTAMVLIAKIGAIHLVQSADFTDADIWVGLATNGHESEFTNLFFEDDCICWDGGLLEFTRLAEIQKILIKGD